jgi:predicted outer membrane repeat protein
MRTGTNCITSLLIVVFVLVTTATTFAGNIIYVDDDGPADFNNIQAAIDDSSDGDTIIVADGTYTGAGNREISFRGKAITVRSENGTENCIIDCQSKGIGFLFHDGEDANSILSGLTITNGYSSGGGALVISGYSSPMIINCKFENNHSGGYAGAIDCHSNHSPKFTNCIFTGNSSHESGGGIFISEGSPILTNCTFSGNSSVDYGGAVHCEETSSPTIRNCLIIGNKTEWKGGGISNTDGSDAIIENCTITYNIANEKGGGIFSPDRMTVSNSILRGNYPDQIYDPYGRNVVINHGDVQGGWPGSGNIDADPLFVDPGYWDANGLWIEGDYHLLSYSPCIDAGDNTVVTVTTDLDGNVRIFNGIVDMGAYEFPGPRQLRELYVDDDAAGANNGSSWADAYNYLQDALAVAYYSSHEIRVAQGIYKPDRGASITPGDREATFQLINGVALKGGYAGSGEPDPNARDIDLYETILTGDLAGDDGPEFANNGDNSYHVVTCSGTDATAVLDGFIITGGNAGGPYPHGNGGGMNGSGGPTLRNCTIRDNFSLGSGAGIRSSTPGRPILYSCRLIRNLSGDGSGGGISSKKPTLINCTVSGNSAFWSGGGVSCDGGIMINCMFNGNRSERNGGGMSFCDCTPGPTLINCTFSSNTAAQMGGGIYMPHSGVNLLNCILWGNSDIDGMYESSQIYANEPIVVDYSCIQGLTGVLGGIGNIGTDPCFVDPDTGDYHLLPDSPSINAGDPNYIAEPNETDLDGNPRVICGRIDMGAYECQCTIIAEARIVPQTINLASKGKWITSYIWLPEEYDVADIEPNSIFLEDQIQPDEFSVDEQQQVARARFSRKEIRNILGIGEVELTITGQLNDRTSFEATDIIKVTDKADK